MYNYAIKEDIGAVIARNRTFLFTSAGICTIIITMVLRRKRKQSEKR